MKKQKLTTYAAMTQDAEKIRRNSMKLLSYFICIGGKEKGLGTGRLFQHKNIILADIKKKTGLDPKTIKLYLYELEIEGLIQYRGDSENLFNRLYEHEYSNKTEFRKAKEDEIRRVWKNRNKADYYYIPRPNPYTPIPEQTLEILNRAATVDEKNKNDFCFSELGMKIYILCCIYRDIQVENYNGKPKILTFETLREELGIKDSGNTYNKKIKQMLIFLRGLGLVDFELSYYMNSKGAKIECFSVQNVNYYVDIEVHKCNGDDVDDREFIELTRNRLAMIK